MPDMWPLWTWGLRARAGTAVTLAILMATAVAASASGPLLLRAVEQSSLARAVADAGPVATSLSVSADVQPDQTPHDNLVAAQLAVLGAADRLFRGAVMSQESKAAITWSAAGAAAPTGPVTPASLAGGPTRLPRSRLVSTDACAGVRFTAGTCPTRANDVALTTPDALRLRIALGSVLNLTVATLDGTGTRVVPLTVTGTYDGTGAPGVTLTTPGTPDAVVAGATSADLLVTATTLGSLGVSVSASAHRVLARSLRLADLPEVRASISIVRTAALRQAGSYVVKSGLPDLLDGLDRENRAATTIVWVTQLQALALALGAIAVVLQRISRARAKEWAVGRLRGVPTRSWLVSVYAEPVLALVAGSVVGVLLGVAGARLTADAALRAGTPLEPGRAPVLAAILAAVVGALVVLVGASVRSARADLAQLLGASSEDRRTSRLAAVAQSAAVLLAAVTTWQLVSGNGLANDRLGLLAPGLFALALAVLAMQAVTGQVRRAATTPARRLTSLVVVRQLGRTPSVLLRGVVIAIGVSLVVFTTQLTWASNRSQERLAAAEVGAAQVLQVELLAGRDLRAVVATADPSGRVAMAVQERQSSSDSGTGRIVAVDTDRLAAVAAWPSTWAGRSAASLRAALRPPHPPPITLRGSRVTLVVDGVTTTPGPLAPGITSPPVPSVVLTVEVGGRWQAVGFAPLASGSNTLTGRLPCPAGCRLVSIATTASPISPYDASYTISALSTDLSPASTYDAVLRDPQRWQAKVGPISDPGLPWTATPLVSPSGLKIRVHDNGGDNAPAVEPTDLPDPLPAVVGPQTETAPFGGGITGAVPGVGLGGQPQLLREVGHASVLPRAMGDGVLVDLTAAQGLSDPFASQTIDEVWLSPGSHPAVEQALRKAGARIVSRERRSDATASLKQQAPTRAAVVSLLVAGLAALLTLLALVAARVVDAPARRRDWASLRAAGVRPSRIRRLAVLEVAVPAAAAALLGAGAGLAAYALAVRRLPLRLTAVGPPLDGGPSWLMLVEVVVPVLVLLGLVGIALARIESPASVVGGQHD